MAMDIDNGRRLDEAEGAGPLNPTWAEMLKASDDGKGAVDLMVGPGGPLARSSVRSAAFVGHDIGFAAGVAWMRDRCKAAVAESRRSEAGR